MSTSPKKRNNRIVRNESFLSRLPPRAAGFSAFYWQNCVFLKRIPTKLARWRNRVDKVKA